MKDIFFSTSISGIRHKLSIPVLIVRYERMNFANVRSSANEEQVYRHIKTLYSYIQQKRIVRGRMLSSRKIISEEF